MVVIAIFRVIKAPFIDGNLSIIDCYAEAVHVFRNFVHVIKNRLVGAPVHVIEKTVHVHENCCSRVLRILILEKFCWSALENAGLELYAGLLHVDRPGKPSLVLDFMEEYRAWVVDRNIIKLRARLGKETSLTPDLKTEIINGIDATMSAFITHRGKKVRLENIMQRQAYRLAGAMTDGKRYKSIRFKW